jgi:hypothetical protein
MDYRDLLAKAPDAEEMGAVISFLCNELPHLWWDAYEQQNQRQINLLRVELGTFVYVYDFYSGLEATGAVPVGPVIEDRLVGAFGTSTAPTEVRDPARMRGWVGPTEQSYGSHKDKGHVFGRALGGGLDGPGINLWAQSRSLNRGWSAQGRLFRKMERYCAAHLGTFCFTRPSYGDQTSQPIALEFGILLPDRTLWVEEFEN